MKIKPEQLSQHLQNTLSLIYIVSGDEPLLQQEACDSIRKAAIQQQYAEKQIFFVENSKSFNWQSLLEAANSLSLFSDKTFLDLRLPSGKPGDTGAKILMQYAENPPPDKILLITTGKLDAATQKAKWFTALEKVGVFVAIWPLFANQLPIWLKQRFQKVGLQLEPAALKLFSDQVEGNLLAADQEIEKLRLIYGPGKLNEQQILEATTNHNRYDIFNLVDAVFSGDNARIIRLLKNLKALSEEPTILLWALTRELRVLAQITWAVSSGSHLEAQLQTHKIWENRKSLYRKVLQSKKTQHWYTLIHQAKQIDEMIKGIQRGHVWDELMQLCLSFHT
ncbi:MAG: DNA polymerase III subunit delta [Proteobacteria bacterium]|nr:DNA polymerase III subunit delta [Pseudomonadota bacterium]